MTERLSGLPHAEENYRELTSTPTKNCMSSHSSLILAGTAEHGRISPARSAQLYRQAQIWTRQGLAFDRSTLASWVGTAAAEIAPVVARLKEIVLASARLFADDAVVPMLYPGRGRTKQGYFWAIARDDRPWGGKDPARGGVHLRPRTRAPTWPRTARRLSRHPAM